MKTWKQRTAEVLVLTLLTSSFAATALCADSETSDSSDKKGITRQHPRVISTPAKPIPKVAVESGTGVGVGTLGAIGLGVLAVGAAAAALSSGGSDGEKDNDGGGGGGILVKW